MNSNIKVLLVNDIKLSVNASFEEAFSLAEKRLNEMRINTRNVKFSIYRKSIDARKKNDIKFVYTIRAEGDFFNLSKEKLLKNSISVEEPIKDIELSKGECALEAPPLVVGSGPCGLFAALLLAEQGYSPILIERGAGIAERKKCVMNFSHDRIFNSETNIQFGAGGAGTFSDGKLITRINDPLVNYVLRRFVDFGAPKEILYLAKPHIGTDVLCDVVDKMTNEIIRLGGRVMYHTKLISLKENGRESIAVTSSGEIKYGAIVLAVGHSARDTYKELIHKGFSIEAKNFSVGMRIEHLASHIDKAMYGDFAGHKNLGHAEYNLSYNTKSRGVYTFCMCPGGEVVAAASEEFGVVVNGMSKHARDGINSNSAVVCSIFKEDYGSTPEAAIELQRKIERDAFIAGGSNYSAPIITVGDFLAGECKKEPYEVFPTYMDGKYIKLVRPEKYLPQIVCKSISDALLSFDNKIKGFADSSAILTGAETRTSAPIRITRDPITRTAIGYNNIYPAGEGAGYAGGITSAAIDGIRTAISIINKYKPTKVYG